MIWNKRTKKRISGKRQMLFAEKTLLSRKGPLAAKSCKDGEGPLASAWAKI